jgi:hypothetical protein
MERDQALPEGAGGGADRRRFQITVAIKRAIEKGTSRTATRSQKRIAEYERTLASTRKKRHGELCNKVISPGRINKTAKVSYKLRP